MELRTTLNELAHRIVENGTESEVEDLETLAATVAALAPGASAALTDWDGAEVTRARAFARVVGAVLYELSSWEQAALRDELTGVRSLALVA
jgi:hypothetical protein